MQTENLFELTYILLDKKTITAGELAAHFGVSTRTIYRWVDALNLAGVPVYTTKGKGGGISVSDTYALDKTVFTDAEKQELLASVQAFQALSGTKAQNGSTQSAISKLKALTGAQTDWIEIDFEPWNSKSAEVQRLFTQLKTAVIEKQQIQFDYYSMRGESNNRAVQPLKIIFKGQSWYLKGICLPNGEERFFKLSRMRNLTVLATRMQINPQQVTKAESAATSDIYHSETPPKMIRVTLLVPQKNMPMLLDDYTLDTVTHNPDGTCSITLFLPDFYWLDDYLLGLGDETEVLEPAFLRERIRQKVANLAKRYLS